MPGRQYEYYELIAEQICFKGISNEQLLKIVRYKEGKSLKDVDKAIQEGRIQGMGDTNREFGCMATNLSTILTIDTDTPLGEFREKIREACK